MKNRYQSMIRRDGRIERAAERVNAECRSDLERIAANVLAPVLNSYVRWILREAERRGVSKLLFLSRDGWIPFQIARIICDQENIAIPCDYFFCSRFSLRMAAYWLRDDSAYEKLFLRAYRLSAKIMLKRADFSESERLLIYQEIQFPPEHENDPMSRADFASFCDSVKKSSSFQKILYKKSRAAYAATVDYFRRNLTGNIAKIGIVDIGWTGSLQAAFKSVLESAGMQIPVIGFYIGLLDPPPARPDSVYAPWLFSWRDDGVKAWFSHNLLECLCSAPHGMTVGYQRKATGEKISPVFAPPENNLIYSERVRAVCVKFTLACPFLSYQPEEREIALRLLKNLMFRPTQQEIAALSDYQFCDDTAEQYHNKLIRAASPAELRGPLLPRVLFHPDAANAFYWYYGSLQASLINFKIFYRYAYFITRFLILRWKQHIPRNTDPDRRCYLAESNSHRHHVRL